MCVCEWEQSREREREGESLHCARLIIKMSPVTLFALLYISQRGEKNRAAGQRGKGCEWGEQQQQNNRQCDFAMVAKSDNCIINFI